MSTIQVKYENDDGDEVELDLPSKMEVCYDCEGHGTVLTASIREHAYSREEFEESFDDEEDRQAYFSRGGKYDVECPTCHGCNVIAVVDEEHIPENLKAEYAAYQEYKEEMDQLDAECEAESRMERLMGC